MATGSTDPVPYAVAAFMGVAWLGKLLGVSLVSTPVKFQASSLDLPVALEVGRVTFELSALFRLGWRDRPGPVAE